MSLLNVGSTTQIPLGLHFGSWSNITPTDVLKTQHGYQDVETGYWTGCLVQLRKQGPLLPESSHTIFWAASFQMLSLAPLCFLDVNCQLSLVVLDLADCNRCALAKTNSSDLLPRPSAWPIPVTPPVVPSFPQVDIVPHYRFGVRSGCTCAWSETVYHHWQQIAWSQWRACWCQQSCQVSSSFANLLRRDCNHIHLFHMYCPCMDEVSLLWP